MVHLYNDGLHLNNYEKDELANNFIDYIDSFLRKNIFQMSEFWLDSVWKDLPTKTNHTNSEKENSNSDDSFDSSSENQQSNNELDLEGLLKLRNQYHSNPSLIGYLNINFLKHKID